MNSPSWGDGVSALAAFARTHSPFLARLIAADADRLERLGSRPAAETQAELVERQLAVGDRVVAVDLSRDDAVRELRLARNTQALLVALADIGGVWSVDEVTAALSDFADASVASAVAIAAAEAGLSAPESGLVVLALGKHGARELNYSSDIDLIVLYDPTSPAAGTEPARRYTRLAQTIARLLQERTVDGFVHRVDYRLRPDPASTPVAISLPFAYGYYETVGQNWERAAMIKARPVAGEIGLGRLFLAELTPFVWRKYFDFAAIADIHAMKRQIHAVRGHDVIAVAGHDIKLGRGGIREIEFFVQTQQLVFGGRRPSLRGRRTLDMLAELHAEGWVSQVARDQLSEAYRFLRRVEHRLQMVADEQTQRLPTRPEDLDGLARFCGYPDLASFSADLTGHAGRVQAHYSLLFEEGAELASDLGDLVFTGAEVDTRTSATLGRMGFRDPDAASEIVRGWHFGRRPAVRSARAREVLTELVPSLLGALGGSADPDGALARLDRAFDRMPAAVELLTVLKSHERLRLLFADLLGTAPALAETVAQTPHVLDIILDPSFSAPARDERTAESDLRALVGRPADTETFLDALRDAHRQLHFATGARFLSGVISAGEAGAAYAALASAAIRVALAWVEFAFASEHGTVPGGRIAVLGLGRLGAGDLTASSDLDLVVLYDFDRDSRTSSGPRPLDAALYYARLTQRLVAALTAPTRRGRLFELDLRLRPSGTKGPIATQFSGFVAYHHREAELWEHMSLTRARVLAGDETFALTVADAVRTIVALPRPPAEVYRAVAAMRSLVAKEKGEGGPSDLKLAPGGLIDIDFIAQALVLAHADRHPSLAGLGTAKVFSEAAGLGLLDAAGADSLRTAHDLVNEVLHWQRLTRSAGEGRDLSPATLRRCCLALGSPDPVELQARLTEARREARSTFSRVIGPVSAA